MFNDYTSKTAKYVSFLGWALLIVFFIVGVILIAINNRYGNSGNFAVGVAFLACGAIQFLLTKAFSIVVEACYRYIKKN